MAASLELKVGGLTSTHIFKATDAVLIEHLQRFLRRDSANTLPENMTNQEKLDRVLIDIILFVQDELIRMRTEEIRNAANIDPHTQALGEIGKL